MKPHCAKHVRINPPLKPIKYTASVIQKRVSWFALPLIYFKPIFYLYTPENVKKPFVFRRFLGV